MAQDNAEDPSIDGIDPLELLAALDGPDAVEPESTKSSELDEVDGGPRAGTSVARIEDDNDSDEDVQIVDPSELMEPLAASDVIGLDYDEEIPTRVEGRRSEQREETFPPAQQESADVFYLTNERLPSLTRTAEDHVSISDVLQAPPVPKMVGTLPPVHPPPRRNTILPPGSRVSSVSSIAPVALPSEHEEPLPVPAPRIPGRGVYGSVVVVLAAAAAVIALWPSDKSIKSVEHAQTIAQPAAAAVVNTTETNDYEPETVTLQLDVVEILSDAPMVAGVGEKAPLGNEGVRPTAEADPSKDVVIDDTAQPESKAVFPTSSAGDEASSSLDEEPQKLTPPEPPSADPLPFDRGAAAAAMSAAAGMAQACRSEGMPLSSARISVTFAPTGRVTTAVIDGERFSGSAEGGCIARTFRTLRVAPFSGPPVTVRKSFQF